MPKHVHRTAVFTLHVPNQRTRDILNEALENYTRAYTNILDFFKDYTAQELHAMSIYTRPDGSQDTSARALETALFRKNKIPDLDKMLEPLEARLRASLKSDVASTLSSYAELSLTEKQKPSYPNRMEEQNLKQRRLEALEGLRTIADDLEEENTLRDQSLRTRQRGLIPLSFGNSMPDQGFRIFLNRITHHFYARLYVIGASSIFKGRIANQGEYIDIREPENIYVRHGDFKAFGPGTKSVLGEYSSGLGRYHEVKSFGTGTRSILVPLKIGHWHENGMRFINYGFLSNRWHSEAPPMNRRKRTTNQWKQRTDRKALHSDAKPAWPVSAKLMKKGDDYQLHVAFQIDKPERITPETYLGIDRSFAHLASGAVVSLDGKEIIDTFDISTTELYSVISAIEKNIATKQKQGKTTKGDRRRARIADQHVHQAANKIVEVAMQHKAQVVIEDLSYVAPKKRKGRVSQGFNKVLNRRQYQKLQDILETKLNIAGLPGLRKISPAYTASTCSQCGCVSKENFDKEDRARFKCIECGHEDNVYQQSSVNIVRKLPFLALRSKEKQREVPEAERTTWEQFARSFKT